MYLVLSNRITNYLINNDLVTEDEREIYVYGFELFISSLINFIIVFFIGFIFNRLLQTLIFLITFCPLRQYSGGYHATNHFKCTVYFNLIYISVIFFEKNILLNNSQYISILTLILASLIIALLCPIQDKNKPLSIMEKKYFQRTAIKILIVCDVVITITVLDNFYRNYSIYAVIAIVLLACLMVVGKIKNLKGEFNEKYVLENN